MTGSVPAPTMRAIVQDTFGGPETLRPADVRRPVPRPAEVLVRVHSAGVNPVDWKTRSGGGMAGVLGEPPRCSGRSSTEAPDEGWGNTRSAGLLWRGLHA